MRLRLTLLVLLAACGSLHAQVTGVRISTEPNTAKEGIPFTVDGQSFQGAATFLWPQGSKHTVSVNPQTTGNRPKTIYTFTGWTVIAAATTLVPDVSFIVTASPELKSVTASFLTDYEFDLVYFSCPPGPKDKCAPPGTIYVTVGSTDLGTSYIETTPLYYVPGTVLTLRASPSPGYIFTGWLVTPGFGNYPTPSFVVNYTVGAPLTVYPQFQLARPVSITLDSSPPNLQLLADRTAISGPINLEWGLGTTHTLGVLSPQDDKNGQTWVFDSWSDGGTSTHSFLVKDGYSTLPITARFVPGGRVSFLTNPPGLKLTINGRDNWPSYTFSGAAGTVYHIAAPAQQTDAQGMVNKFVSWSNGRTETQDYTQAPSDDRITANYEKLGKIVLRSSTPGITFQVNSASCGSPCTLDLSQGTSVAVSAPPSIAVADGARLDFTGWLEAASPDRTIVVGSGISTFTANYQLRYRVVGIASPLAGGTVEIQPPAADDFYDANSSLVVNAVANPGFRLRGGSPATTAASGPRLITALFDPVPYLPPAAVQSAAGETPLNAVAPGSVVSIFGLNLAAGTQGGPSSPLVQTLLNVTVRIGDRLLAIFFVSPQQINVQLPFDTVANAATVTVRQEGQPDVSADFTVARNAPGLFSTGSGDRTYATATHEDGTVITPDSPARQGEVVTLLGTGFGPYDRTPPDGLLLPASATFQLVDPVVVTLAGLPADVLSAGFSTSAVGLNVVRFRMPVTGQAGGRAPVQLQVNGIWSNTVSLPN